MESLTFQRESSNSCQKESNLCGKSHVPSFFLFSSFFRFAAAQSFLSVVQKNRKDTQVRVCSALDDQSKEGWVSGAEMSKIDNFHELG